LKMPAFEWVHVQLHQQKGMISLSPPTICNSAYQKLLLKHQLLPSMSGKGNCFDNSAVESFFKSLKAELIWRRHWQTRRDIEIAIFEYINGFYNPRRRHSTLGWKSPVAFEKKAA
ncbi:IS3 family transposase, partial [Klebsiella pneumoniae]|uniref:IS3 family transposase n=1 Tax=Klebsiella pneumoniae TaxID=573 RepID=UPI00216885D3